MPESHPCQVHEHRGHGVWSQKTSPRSPLYHLARPPNSHSSSKCLLFSLFAVLTAQHLWTYFVKSGLHCSCTLGGQRRPTPLNIHKQAKIRSSWKICSLPSASKIIYEVVWFSNREQKGRDYSKKSNSSFSGEVHHCTHMEYLYQRPCILRGMGYLELLQQTCCSSVMGN